MKRIIIFTVLVLSFSLFASAQETKTVTAEGVATVGNDPSAARDKAIEDALRRAVEQAVGTMVESETATENYELLSDKIYSRSQGYVKNYDVLSENTEGNLLRVKISAEVSSGDLSNELSAIGLLQRRMKYPRVLVIIPEENVMGTTDSWQTYSVSSSQAEATVIAKLKAKGFNVVDPNYQRKAIPPQQGMEAYGGNYDVAGQIGTKMGAEIVIVGKATSTRSANNIAGSDLLSETSTINASAVKSGTGEVIAQASGQGTAAHINEVAAMQQSLQKAADQVGDQLITGILDTWQRESSGQRSLAMAVQDVSPPELDKLKAGLEKIRGVTEVLVRNFDSGSADINIQSKTDGEELAKSISKASFPGFRLMLIQASTDRLEYRVVH
jgi:Flagellar assembly protein T, N-terminal domain